MSPVNLQRVQKALDMADSLVLQGKVLRASGLIIEAALPRVAVGTGCEIKLENGRAVAAEVVGFAGPTALLMPCGEMQGIREGAPVIPRASLTDLSVGEGLLGRVVDSALKPVDGGGPLPPLPARIGLYGLPPPAMTRRRISRIMPSGIRCLDSVLTLGEGQRMGVMAGPGVGKSVLLGMIARHASADVIVCGLIGERGREVREFVERDLGAGLRRSVVIVATADESPLVRVRAAMSATAVAEYFRSQGKKVMLLMDSLSRVAMAQREIGLAAGEPPTSKGYPPSVFALLPRLLERAGTDSGEGSITGLYTALAEGDDIADPITDAARAALDGHIVLSRKLAGAGHFPAIDVLGSVSRVMNDIVSKEHLELAMQAREILSAYQEASDLIEVGAYMAGSNPRVDRAIKHVNAVNSVLRQGPDARFELRETLFQLGKSLDASVGGRP